MGERNWLELTADEEEILFKAAEEPTIIEAVSRFNQGEGNKVEIMKNLRELLRESFPEIAQLPPVKRDDAIAHIFPPPSGDFRITRALIALLREKPKRPDE